MGCEKEEKSRQSFLRALSVMKREWNRPPYAAAVLGPAASPSLSPAASITLDVRLLWHLVDGDDYRKSKDGVCLRMGDAVASMMFGRRNRNRCCDSAEDLQARGGRLRRDNGCRSVYDFILRDMVKT